MSLLASKRVLVTGVSGYVAATLIPLLQSAGASVVRLSRGNSLVSCKDCLDVTGDLRDCSVWQRALEDVDIVFHLAAQTSVQVANANAAADFGASVLPMLQLLESCRDQRRQIDIVFAGTVTQTGIPSRLPVDETHPDVPITVYDLHKLMAEQYLEYFARAGVVRGATLRLANVYGPGPKSSGPGRGMLNEMIRRALRGEALTVYGTGGHQRDYVYVDDVAQAFLAAAGALDRINGQHFVIGSGVGHSIAEAARMVAERVGVRTGRVVAVEHVDPPEGLSAIESRDFIADSRRFEAATNWKARTSLVEGIDKTIEEFAAHGD